MYYPPMNISYRDINIKTIFLAGSIEMGIAEDYQSIMGDFISNQLGLDVFNPRRTDWDNSWEQTFQNPQFSQQVNWELNALDKCDYIIMYFDPKTKSPISLLELGLYADSGKLFVVCPDGFWRKGNVDIVCNKYNIPMFNSLEQLKNMLPEIIK